MPRYKVTLDNGEKYSLETDREVSDSEISSMIQERFGVQEATPAQPESPAPTTTTTAPEPAPKEGLLDSIKRGVNFEIGRQIAGGLTPGAQQETLPQIFRERTGVPAAAVGAIGLMNPWNAPHVISRATATLKPKEIWEKKFDPLVAPLPKTAVLPDDTPVNAAVKSVLNLGASFGDFAQSPAGVATVGIGSVGAIPKAIVEGLFTVDMLKGFIKEGTRLWSDWDQLTTAQKIEGTINEVGTAGMAGMLGLNLKNKTIPKARQEARMVLARAQARAMAQKTKNLSSVQTALPPASAPLMEQNAPAAAPTAAPPAPAAPQPAVTPGPATGSSPSSTPTTPTPAPVVPKTPTAPQPPPKPDVQAPTPPAAAPAKRFQGKLYQGRGATPAEIYGEAAVKAGRAIPILGEADYFAYNNKDAARYGKEITQHDVMLENPLLINSTRAWRKVLDEAGTPVLDSRGMEWYEHPELIPGATRQLQEYLRSKGYDGVIVEIPENADMNAAGESIKGLRESFGHSQVIRFRKGGKGSAAKGAQKTAEPPTTEAPKTAAPTPEQRAEFEKRYVDLAERTSAKEKVSKPEDWTPEQKAAWEAQDWQKFSRLRGYTEEEIAEYKQFVDAYDEGRRLGYSEDELMELSRAGEERARKSKAKQSAPAPVQKPAAKPAAPAPVEPPPKPAAPALRPGRKPQRLEAEVARRAAALWKSRMGSYKEGEYKKQNEDQAAHKAQRYAEMADRAERGELTQSEIEELAYQNKKHIKIDVKKWAADNPPTEPLPAGEKPSAWSKVPVESDAIRSRRAILESRRARVDDMRKKVAAAEGKPTQSALRARLAKLEEAVAAAEASLTRAGAAEAARPKEVKPHGQEVQGQGKRQEVATQPTTAPGEPTTPPAAAGQKPEGVKRAKGKVKTPSAVSPEQGKPIKPGSEGSPETRTARGKRKGGAKPQGEEEKVVLTRKEEIAAESKMKGVKKLLDEFEEDETNQKDFITWMHANGKLLRRRTSFPIRTDVPPKRVLKGKKWVLVEQRTMDTHYEDAPSRTEDLSDIWWEKQYYSDPKNALLHDAPDQLAKEAFEAGILPDSRVDTMWDELKKSIARRKKYIESRKSGFDPNDPLTDQERKLVDFYDSSSPDPARKQVIVDDLYVGDEFTVAGENCKVVGLDPDTGEFTVDDGERFGIFKLSPGTTVHVESYKPKTARDLLDDFLGSDVDPAAKAAATGPLETGQRPAEDPSLLANNDMPFNLTGERAVEPAKPAATGGPAGPEQLSLLDVKGGKRIGDAVQAADVAERMYGGPQAAIDRIQKQLETLDRDPATARTVDADQRKAIADTIAVLRSRIDLGKNDPPAAGSSSGRGLGPLFDFFDDLDKNATKIINDELGGVHDIAQLAMNVRAAAALVAKGASIIAKGTIRFAHWAPQFLAQTSSALRPLLGSIYNRAQAFFSAMRNRFGSGRRVGPAAAVPVTPPPTINRMAGALNNGRGFLGQLMGDSVGWALRGYSEWMVDRLRRVGGQVSAQMANAANQMISHQRLLYGQLTPHLDVARRLAGRFNRATRWLHQLDRITPYAAVARVVRAIEGTIQVPAWARQVVDAGRLSNLDIGRLAQLAHPGFIASGLWQRNLTAYGMDLIQRGGGRQWMHWAEGLAAANNMPLARAIQYLRDLKTEFDRPGLDIETVRRINQDFARQFPNIVTHVRTMFGWEAVLHADLFSYLENAAQRTAHSVAFRQVFPTNQAFARVRAAVQAELPTDTQSKLFDSLMRTLQGFPTDNIAWISPDNIIGMGVRMGLQTFNSVMGKLALTLQLAVQPGETMFGATPQFLGMRNYAEALIRLKQLYPQLEQMGAVNRVMRDFTYDPHAKLRSISRLAGSSISKLFGEDVFNELQEGAAAATAHVVVERIMTDRLSKWERRMLPQTFRAMGFTDAQVASMMSNATPIPQRVRLLEQFQRRAASWLTSGNKQMAEGSRLGASRLFNSIFRFQSYPMMKANQLRRVFGNVQRAIESGNRTEIVDSVRMAGRFLFGTALQGAVTTGIVTLATQGLSGGKSLAAEIKDDTASFIAESFLATIGGPLYVLTKMQRNTGITGIANAIGNAAFPLSTFNEMVNASWGTGPYSDLTPADRLGEFARRRVPGLRPIRMAMAAVGLSQENVGLDSAMRAFWKWRADIWGRDVRESHRKLDERKVFRTHMKRAVKFLNNGEMDKFTEALQQAATAGNKEDSVKRSLLGKRLLKDLDGAPLSPERIAELRKRIGEDAYLRLEGHDAMLEAVADAL